MTTPVHLTAQTVAQAALKGYEANDLPAQHGESCLYITRTGHRCAVGQALPQEMIDKLKDHHFNYMDVIGLQNQGLLTCEPAVATLQRVHDAWARASIGGASSEDDEQRFLRLARELAQ